jgi:hypothetical protein
LEGCRRREAGETMAASWAVGVLVSMADERDGGGGRTGNAPAASAMAPALLPCCTELETSPATRKRTSRGNAPMGTSQSTSDGYELISFAATARAITKCSKWNAPMGTSQSTSDGYELHLLCSKKLESLRLGTSHQHQCELWALCFIARNSRYHEQRDVVLCTSYVWQFLLQESRYNSG